MLHRSGLDALVTALAGDGYTVVGPTVHDGTVTLGQLRSTDDLPQRVRDDQRPGSYRLVASSDGALFGHAVGAQSWKQFLSPPRTLLVRTRRTADGFESEAPEDERLRYAFVGVRPCDLAAIAVLDRVFLDGGHPDAGYLSRREAFIVAVDCARPAATCFCTSAGGSPRATGGFDLALTEVVADGGTARYVVRVGSERAAGLLARVPHRPATAGDVMDARRATEDAAEAIGRRVDGDGLPGILTADPESDRWQEVADRCIACGNCTMVCPTCFCTTVEDVTDLRDEQAERWRRWDSCFTLDFSYLHGGSVRRSIASRYRQWLTHKLATWHDQFGTSGCVGCGRCITWCPVGIDITEEVAAHRAAAAG